MVFTTTTLGLGEETLASPSNPVATCIFHRALLDTHGFADFAIGMSRAEQVQHLSFALREDHRILQPEVMGHGRDALDEFAEYLP